VVSSIWTLRRSTSDVKLAGLCGGIARDWGVDPLLVRVGFVLLALSGGVGLILYLAGWLLLPTDGRDTALVEDLFGSATRRWPREVWIVIVSISCVAALTLFSGLTPFGIWPALIIAIIWYFGVYRAREADRDGGQAGPPAPPPIQAPPPAPFHYPGPPTPFTEAAEAWQRRIAEYQSSQSPPSAGGSGSSWPVPPAGNFASVSAADLEQHQRAAFLATADPVGLYAEPTAVTRTGSVARPGRRLSARRLGWATLLMLGLTLTGLGLADYLGAVITPTVYAAAALLVVGLALVLATWLGRARGLLPVGVVLALAVLGLSATGPGLRDIPPSMATSRVAYSTPAELPARGDHRDVGTLIVDLSGLPVRTDTAYAARVDLGAVDVIVPPGTQVVVRYAADGGSVTTFGRSIASGSDLRGVVTDPQPLRPDRPTLTLDLTVDLGTVQVRR
jgi:phage shock protein PspC (stress-responsive transcriptional regulator)